MAGRNMRRLPNPSRGGDDVPADAAAGWLNR